MHKNDWRLTNQMNYLFQKTLIKRRYEPFREGWEHDHCEFCGDLIDFSAPFAYATENNYNWFIGNLNNLSSINEITIYYTIYW